MNRKLLAKMIQSMKPKKIVVIPEKLNIEARYEQFNTLETKSGDFMSWDL